MVVSEIRLLINYIDYMLRRRWRDGSTAVGKKGRKRDGFFIFGRHRVVDDGRNRATTRWRLAPR